MLKAVILIGGPQKGYYSIIHGFFIDVRNSWKQSKFVLLYLKEHDSVHYHLICQNPYFQLPDVK